MTAKVETLERLHSWLMYSRRSIGREETLTPTKPAHAAKAHSEATASVKSSWKGSCRKWVTAVKYRMARATKSCTMQSTSSSTRVQWIDEPVVCSFGR